MNAPPTNEARLRRLWPAGAVLLAAALAALWFLLRPAAPAAVPVASSPAAKSPADGVELSDEQLRSQGITSAAVAAATQLPLPGLPAQAGAALESSARVAVPYAGVVTRILVDEGAPVRRGQALARLRSQTLLAAQGELARARSEATAAAQQARRDALLLSEGIIAASRHEQSQARAGAAEAGRRQAEGALANLRPAAGGQPGEYELLAPIAGQVLRRLVAPGQALAALDEAFVVAEPGPLDVTFTAPVRVRGALTPGLAVRLPDGGAARVVAVGADTDPASQSLRLRARMAGGAAGAGYVAGQQFSVTLMLPAPAGTLAVPTAALLPAGQGHLLFRRDGRRIRAVRVQEMLGGDAETSIVRADGLSPGAQVVTHGTALLKSLIAAE
ncbi:MAG: efflux RND transporter periplasmic adaptor subunit [Burkholderiales bacterium]|nr:efflux RND transporter periplasmic adaptor subunit [Burkholderiales bacterium]